MVAPIAIRMGGRSAHGTAQETLPPTVAMLRICLAAICEAASRIGANPSRTRADWTTSVIVVRAPMRSPVSVFAMPRNSSIRLSETRCPTETLPVFRSTRRSVPPANRRTSGA